jgi:hypothetical protein
VRSIDGIDAAVEVFRRSRLCMKGDRISADDEIFNAVRVEYGQEFFEVSEHPASIPSFHAMPW